jgi:curved DNA-binding protein CbpA
VADVQAVTSRWYRRLVLRWHPDRGGHEAGMKAINDAQDLLGRMLQELR